MKRIVFLALALAGCDRQPQTAFQNASFTLPDDMAQLPDGPNVDLVRAACTGCHSPEMILTQPRFDAKVWTTEVEKMAKVYKAPIDPKDVPAIVAYLEATNARVAH